MVSRGPQSPGKQTPCQSKFVPVDAQASVWLLSSICCIPGPLLHDVCSPSLKLWQLNTGGDTLELAEIDRVRAFVLHHLQEQLDLVDVVHELGLKGLVLLVFLEHALDLLTRECASGDIAQQCPGNIVHNSGFAAGFLRLGNMGIDRGNVANQRLGHIVNESHLGAVRDIQLRSQPRRGKHRHDRHAVHMVRNRLAIDTEAAPTFALGGLETLDQVKKGDRRRGVLLWGMRESG